MDPKRAADALRELKQQADTDALVQADSSQHIAWRTKVQGLLDRSLGNESATATRFRKLSYHFGVWTGAPGEAEQDRRHFADVVKKAASIVEAAVFELDLLAGEPEQGAVPASYFDQGLWNHVKHNVDEERWDQVASSAVIYTEDKVRRWSGNPLDKDGRRLVGKDLFVKALSLGGPLALGGQVNEHEGWRNLGTGLVAALGNVDRHNVQEREDLQCYAIGVVGLASLLLTQIQWQHPEAVRNGG